MDKDPPDFSAASQKGYHLLKWKVFNGKNNVTYVYIQTALCWQNIIYVMFRRAKRLVVMVRLPTLSSWLPKHKGFARRYARESCYDFRVTSEITSSIPLQLYRIETNRWFQLPNAYNPFRLNLLREETHEWFVTLVPDVRPPKTPIWLLFPTPRRPKVDSQNQTTWPSQLSTTRDKTKVFIPDKLFFYNVDISKKE